LREECFSTRRPATPWRRGAFQDYLHLIIEKSEGHNEGFGVVALVNQLKATDYAP
jgi:hypothetical protein